ncbi:hypothetical protein FLONG3_3913 [Fusarium longipes]|uniref:Uncharacterized protein n=1 Tax=Fusarium longipes TaxID=694270 RepID=A0A395T0E8_9HYPO|nr:hypothetical protein FLONG3_3913 [Fusarium longipes]
MRLLWWMVKYHSNGDFDVEFDCPVEGRSIYLTDVFHEGVTIENGKICLGSRSGWLFGENPVPPVSDKDKRRFSFEIKQSPQRHSEFPRFIVEFASNDEFILRPRGLAGHDDYIAISNNGVFSPCASREDAQRFKYKVTQFGVELWVDGGRPATIGNSFGKYEEGSLSIPILIHDTENMYVVDSENVITKKQLLRKLILDREKELLARKLDLDTDPCLDIDAFDIDRYDYC